MNFGLSNIMLQLSTIRITCAMGAAAAKSRVGVLVAPDRSVRVDGIDLTFDATKEWPMQKISVGPTPRFLAKDWTMMALSHQPIV
jgi:hypothetical protein